MKESLAEVLQTPVDIRALVHLMIESCAEAKGKDPRVLDVSKLTDICEYLVIVSGRSDRQVQGLCNRVLETLGGLGIEPQSIEGLDRGHWVVMDFGEVVMHVFYEQARSHFDIEGLWAKAPRVEDFSEEQSSNQGQHSSNSAVA